MFNDVVPAEDATVIAKLKSAGAILLGKLNITEFGTTSLSHAFTTVRNPWDLECFTGGSSSGSGGATAAFWCATSLGEDTGGSVRGPAAWC
jgi:Asp-tRNA(Asn)/Glu-tRNA(Gln) amidotransferase A subunit family amidase